MFTCLHRCTSTQHTFLSSPPLLPYSFNFTRNPPGPQPPRLTFVPPTRHHHRLLGTSFYCTKRSTSLTNIGLHILLSPPSSFLRYVFALNSKIDLAPVWWQHLDVTLGFMAMVVFAIYRGYQAVKPYHHNSLLESFSV